MSPDEITGTLNAPSVAMPPELKASLQGTSASHLIVCANKLPATFWYHTPTLKLPKLADVEFAVWTYKTSSRSMGSAM